MSVPRGPSIAVVAVLGVVAFGVAGAALVGVLESDPDAEALVTDVIDDDGGVDTVRATEISTHELYDVDEDEPRVLTTKAEIEVRPPDHRRTTVISSTGPEIDAGDVTVVNGSTRTHYFADSERMMVDDESDWEAIQHSPETLFESFDVEYVGTDDVDGREAHVVEIEPATDAAAIDGVSILVGETEYVLGADANADASNASRTTTWWIDVEAGFPIKERIVTEHENPREHVLQRERTVRTVTYENVRFDEPIPDERFAFDPPDGTEIYEPAESFDVSTFAEADDAVPFPIAEPTPPDGFELELVTANEFEGDSTVQFLYRDGDDLEDDSLLGRITERPPAYDPEDVREEGVGDVDGSLVSTSMGTTLVWHCGDVRYELTPDVDGDGEALAVAVAESTGCPP
ncbi:LolA family protein [Natrarchaeobius oligotrophus]|uniref:Outer membrane lipoprotein carrier protein LolA n=1 Tax=Natrarchaeobius chitinivorans TaxID=1679083 RepID=A0A3N6M7S7_NATCH|nr:hypothetical protein [Natrarchaeobius chitinivorans]RQG98327.1 hypothetical protein EA472_18115 [Natrarchaeobius chitinivorans]